MKLISAILLLFTLTGLITQTRAENGFILEGIVMDSATRTPLSDVIIESSSFGETHSDANGRFVMNFTRPSRVQLRFSRDGYIEKLDTFRGYSGDRISVQIQLEKLPIYVDQAFVEAESIAEIEPVQKMSPETVVQVPGAFEDAMQSLRAMPGVISGDDYSARLYVRGGRPDQNGIYLDGIPIYDPYRLFGFTSLFNPETLKTVRLFPGGFDVRYGDRLSAVIDVENRHGTMSRLFSGSINTSLTNANLMAEGRLLSSIPSSYLISARRTYYDILLKAMDESDSSYPSFTDGQAILYMQPSPEHEWKLTALVTDEGTALSEDLDEDEEETDHIDVGDDQKNYIVGLNGSHLFSKSMRLSYLVSMTRNQQVSDVLFQEGETAYETSIAQDLDSTVNLFRPMLEYYSDSHTIISGVELMRSLNKVTFQINTDDPRVDIPDSLLDFDTRQNFSKYGAFLQDTWEVMPELEIQGGVRWDQSTLSDMSEWSPRASLNYRPIDTLQLRVAWGQYCQFPSYESLQGDGYFLDLRGIKDLNLEPERATHYLIGATWESKSGWELTADMYYKDLSDLLESGEELETVLILDENDTAHPFTRESSTFIPQNTREGYARGADLSFTLLDSPDRPYYGMATYTYSEARSRSNGEAYQWESWDRRHTVTLTGGYQLSKHWDVGWKWQLGTGFPYTPLTQIIRVVEDTDGDGIYEPDAGETFTYQREDPENKENTSRFPMNHRLDLRVQYQRNWGPLDATFYLDVINTYSRNNVQSYDYNEDFTERDEEAGMPFLPSFGVKLKY